MLAGDMFERRHTGFGAKCDMEIKLTATPSEAGELNYSVETYGEVFRVESGR